MGKSWYLHTIDGKPAYYSKDNGQLVVMMRRTQQRGVLVGSLREIRRQQNASRAWRILNACRVGDYEYGYVCFRRDDAPWGEKKAR